MTPTSANKRLLADVFRRESARLIAVLTARVGPAHLDLVEDAVQDALVAALRRWPLAGIPNNPGAWLQIAARNALIDKLRRQRFEQPVADDQTLEQLNAQHAALGADAADDPEREEPFADELLRLLIYCCHPALRRGAQVALTLRLACGLSVEEIGAALFVAPDTIAQRIVRAKQTLQEAQVEFELPAASELRSQRLDSILQVIYLLFDAGYLSTSHTEAIRPLLVADALRLVDSLLSHPATNTPQTRALAAVLQLTAARLPARRAADGSLVGLEQQDRGHWDRSLIASGFRWLDASLEGEDLSRYHIEAAIAAAHARAESFQSTDWREIVSHYDLLLARFPSPAVAVSRAIALRYAEGPERAWAALQNSDLDAPFEDTVLFRAARAELLQAVGATDRAVADLERAIALAGNAHLRQLLATRRAAWTAPALPD
jgi:RNA polymerase sigma-70 factor (ECF subfamily)